MCIPNFRGPNYNRSACGSEKVVKDIVSAVEYAKKHANIDSRRIYLIGVSGGGYAALLMAGRHPEMWAAVSAWVPIYNLADWYKYSKAKKTWYYRHLNNICGGAPGTSEKVDAEYKKRSASTYLKNAKGLNIEISAGLYDNTIPVSHTLRAFNVLAKDVDRLSKEDIEYMRVHKKIPEKLKMKIDDPIYKNKALFRRTSGNVRVTIFEGGHHIMRPAAIEYVKNKKLN
jgi:predicted peptidase